jgi:hypothetical protein
MLVEEAKVAHDNVPRRNKLFFYMDWSVGDRVQMNGDIEV